MDKRYVPVTEAMLKEAFAKRQSRRAPKPTEVYSGAERWTPGKPVTVMVLHSRRSVKGRR